MKKEKIPMRRIMTVLAIAALFSLACMSSFPGEIPFSQREIDGALVPCETRIYMFDPVDSKYYLDSEIKLEGDFKSGGDRITIHQKPACKKEDLPDQTPPPPPCELDGNGEPLGYTPQDGEFIGKTNQGTRCKIIIVNSGIKEGSLSLHHVCDYCDFDRGYRITFDPPAPIPGGSFEYFDNVAYYFTGTFTTPQTANGTWLLVYDDICGPCNDTGTWSVALATATPTPTPTPLPDLGVESMWWNPVEPTITDSVDLGFKARNWGGQTSPSCRFVVELDGKPLSTGNLPSIKAGGYYIIPSVPLGVPGTGEHTVKVTVDSQNTVVESNESNNTLSKNMKIVPSTVTSALVMITPYGDVWGAACQGVAPFGDSKRWGWLGMKYDPQENSLPMKGDFNGDGMDDLVQITPNGDVWVFPRKNESFETSSRWGWLGFYYDEMDGNEGLLPLAGDFNGDGKCDLAQVTFYGDVWTALSSGQDFATPQRWGWLGFKFKRGQKGGTGLLPIAGDVNGDGKCDIVQTTIYGDVWTALSSGSGFDSPERWGWLGFFYRPLDGWLPALADLNGDGRDDILQFTPWGEVWSCLSTGGSFGNPSNWGSLGFGYDESRGKLPIPADVDADGRFDLIQITPTGDPWVAINAIPAFSAPERWGFIYFTFSRTGQRLPLFLGP